MHTIVPRLHVVEEQLQRSLDRREGNFTPGKLVDGKKPGLERFFAGTETAVYECCPIEHVHLVDVGHVNHGVESLYLNLGQSLFPGFTGCSLHCGRSVFHKACRQGPVAVSGFDSATAKKNPPDRKSTRLNSSHVKISYAVFCLKKKK